MYCPECGQQSFSQQDEKAHSCNHCGFTYFHNTASAVLALITVHDEVLVATRAREPGKGMFDFPGGFVDHNESLEQALARELYEELGLPDAKGKYLGSYPNTYQHKGITYKTCDSIFHIALKQKPNLKAADDVADICWQKIDEIPCTRFAFNSAKHAISLIKQ
ncbi:NUDIX domain-containing protein [Photobacterium sanctipauli]|uniref:NUDIX domain-containing protein n=1 Tax=Photobacterium sanctipauli TaxID=1342794 RepID=A0A2T3NNE0_9GAMM|nr:NUDIX domain-containing protein [Photobacterium sanctipauli]PSW17207.1 NUDIX domain-containing protein [Photobacterium sanctipauli]